jgi:hypothetical protein
MGTSASVPSRIKFIAVSDKKSALKLLDEAEKKDLYIEECHDDRSNLLARHNLTYTPNTISERDTNFVNTFLSETMSSLPNRLCSDLDEIKIIQLMPTADGGMPHTRPGDIICCPDISQIFSKSTLIHELWHIHQRNYKELWDKAFKRLGWEMWNGNLPEQLENNRRYNPDTIDSPFWIFDGQWVPVPIFKNITFPKVGDVEIWFYNPVKQYHIKQVPSELQSYFPGLPSSAYEHPRELAAYLLSEPDKYKHTLGFKHLIEQIGHISLSPQN